MKDTKLQKQLISLRILLQKLCDGFDEKDANKKSILTMKHKVLFLLNENGETSPVYLINKLCIAKSNLALLCKGLLEEGLIISKKNESDKRNITYKITQKGEKELDNFLKSMSEQYAVLTKSEREVRLIEKKLDDVINFLNKKI